MSYVEDQQPHVGGKYHHHNHHYASVNTDTETAGSHDESLVSSSSTTEKKLGVLGLVMITYFCVSGGPYGIEVLVASAPPLYVFVGMIVFPFLWSLPLALICAELNSVVNDKNGGGLVSWVQFAFGKFWGYVAGFNASVVALLDNSLYPIICVHYLKTILSQYAPQFYWEDVTYYGPAFAWAVSILIICVVTLVNLLGLEVVGLASLLLTIVVLAPFAVLFGISLPTHSMDFANVFQATGPIVWEDFISNIIWLNVGWLSAGFLANEISNPNRNFPLAMIVAAFFVSLFYILPTAVALSLEGDWQNWQAGWFAKIGGDYGGMYLSVAFTMGSILSNVGVFIAGLSTSARGIAYMANADVRMLPRFLSLSSASFFGSKEEEKDENATNPWMSIVVSAMIVVGMQAVPFQSIQDMEIILNSIVTLLVFGSFLYLRFKHPELPRTYRVPLNNFFSVVVCIPGVCVVLFLAYHTNLTTAIASIISLIATVVTYLIQNPDESRRVWRRIKRSRSTPPVLTVNETTYLNVNTNNTIVSRESIHVNDWK